MFYLKVHDAEQWVSGNYGALVPKLEYYDLLIDVYRRVMPEADITVLLKLRDAYQEVCRCCNVRNTQYDALQGLKIPKGHTTKMQEVWLTPGEPIRAVEALSHFISVLSDSQSILLSMKQVELNGSDTQILKLFNPNNTSFGADLGLGAYYNTLITGQKALNKISKNIKNYTTMEQSTENSLVQKKAWAIFEDNGYKSGFKSKDGSVGDISTARLFDSDKGALKTANAMKLGNFEIAEVEITLKKRSNLKPEFQNTKFLEALSYIEREAINNLIADVGIERVKDAIKKHKI